MTTLRVTALLRAYSSGQRTALDQLMPIVYEELRRVARRHLAGQETGHTLTTTALVHEVYLKLVDADGVKVRDRNHFYALASRAMRQVLIDHARARLAVKRGADPARVRLEGTVLESDVQADRWLALDDALSRLEATHERRCRVVEYRFFGGLSLHETAAVLGISVASVKRDWTLARAWLNQILGPTAGPGEVPDP